MKNKILQKYLVEKSKLVWRKKPTRVKIFRYFHYKSRNNYHYKLVSKYILQKLYNVERERSLDVWIIWCDNI